MKKFKGQYPSFYSRANRVETLLNAAALSQQFQRDEAFNAAIKELERLLDHPDRNQVIRLLAKRSRYWGGIKKNSLMLNVFTVEEKEMFLG